MIVLLPCQTLEDFNLRRRDEDAEELLSAYSVLWHPALLAAARATPCWMPAHLPPREGNNDLTVVPACCEPLLPEDWTSQIEPTTVAFLRGERRRDRVLAVVLERAGVPAAGVDNDLAADFLSLGYCHFFVKLLLHKSGYAGNLDEDLLRTHVLAAADEAVDGDVAASRRHLRSAFDRLHEAREYFHPVAPRLLDMTLLAATTLGRPLCEELAEIVPRNVLASGDVVEFAAARSPETLAALRRALNNNTAGLVGGEWSELPLSLLGPEAIRQQLLRGLAVYEKHLGQRPAVFGRRRFGLSPALPQILEQLRFTAALHYTLDDGRFPTNDQCRIEWEGIDGTSIESLGCVPLDAGRASPFLELPEKLGNAMKIDSSATVVFAHWPGRSSPWYDDLRRIAAYGAVLGEFSTIDRYFETNSLAGRCVVHAPDAYRSPYLRQDAAAGRANPISRWVRYFRRCAKFDAAMGLHMLAVTTEGGVLKSKTPIPNIAEDFLDAADDDATAATWDADVENTARQSLADIARNIAKPSPDSRRGWLIVNPWSFSQRAASVPCPPFSTPSLDVPAMGFLWVDAECDAKQDGPPALARAGWFGREKSKAPLPLADEKNHLLRNEFFEVRLDPHTGAIRSISDYSHRDPRLSQQIAMRLPRAGEPDTGENNYSIMAADEIAVTVATPSLGEIVCRGRLLDRDGRPLASFRQTTTVRCGSRILELLVELDVDRPPTADSWDSYYAVRFAWKDEASQIFRGANMAVVPTELDQIESPHFLDIRRGQQRTTLLFGGLPYHRRVGRRKLDTLLVVRGETARSFRLGVGIDVPHPQSVALGFLAPPAVLPDRPRPAAPSGWLFHLDRRNVLATHWEPLFSEEDFSCDAEDGGVGTTAPNAGVSRLSGLCIRLLETDGRGATLRLRCCRAVSSARRRGSGVAAPTELDVEGDSVVAFIGPHEWIEMEILFA